MKYLNVAEKPSVAKEISRILSKGSCSNVIIISLYSNREKDYQNIIEYMNLPMIYLVRVM